MYGAPNLLDLILSKSGQLQFDWDNAPMVNELLKGTICQSHYAELVANWNTNQYSHNPLTVNKQPKCVIMTNDTIHGVVGNHRITKEMATDYLNAKGSLLPIGSSKNLTQLLLFF